MSNGVEVIVAGDKSTLPGEPDVLRVLPTNIYKPVTLRPSTLTDHMMMIKPDDSQEGLSASLYPNKFVTKTCMTTFTYLTTYLQNGTTTVSSHEQVVSNIATEERVNPTDAEHPEMGITLTQNPNLSVGIYHTTYTYLNTIIDGEQPLVVTSTHTVTNTVTAPQDYLSLLQPSETMTPQRDTNTYYSTVTLEKLISEGSDTRTVSTNEVLTQVVITESVPPKATSVMTSYIALDMEDGFPNQLTTTDMVKTYFVTYTYYNTIVENGSTAVRMNVSTSSDVVTEKLFLQPKKTTKTRTRTAGIDTNDRVDDKGFELLATKTYLTTFTYFTTLLQEENSATPTVISSRSRIVENVITETVDPNLLDREYLNGIKSKINDGAERVTKLATLKDGQEIELTAVVNEALIQPTQVLPIDRTTMPAADSSNPSVITGSTIIFEDDDPFANILQSTPTLQKTSVKNNLQAMLSSEIVKTSIKTKLKTKIAPSSIKQINPTRVKSPEKIKQPGPPEAVPDLLGLGSNYMENLRPVINAVADLIQTNLKSSPKLPEALPLAPAPATQTIPKTAADIIKPLPPEDAPQIENRPIYIPVNFGNDYEVAESQNVETYLQDSVDHSDWNKYTKGSPLINGGIPISPGDVITAHSDVIVGKPGRTMPRIPQIPRVVKPDEDIGMRPPPIHRNDEYKIDPEKPTVVIHAPNRDDYVGPPPPRVKVRGEKHKHIPLNVNRVYAQDRPYEYVDVLKLKLKPPAPAPAPDPLVYAESQNNYAHFRQNELKREREREEHNRSISLDNPINKFNINPTIVLPEVIERATGQPLLVNIQPSQVAFVNIPHNRTTAFVYGGSTELHKNGQYFDDPSPYPQSEFSVVENNNRPQTSIYNIRGDQKQVKGVMKVENSLINNRPNGDVSINIAPTRLQDHQININVAPISFGMIRQGDDFNAHVIRHDEIEFRPPPLSYQVTKEIDYTPKQVQSNKPVFIPTVENLDNLNKINNINRLAVVGERSPNNNSSKNHLQFAQDDTTDLKPPVKAQSQTKQPPPPQQSPNRKYNNNRHNEIVDYMIPPPYKPRPHRKPLPIPISQTNSNNFNKQSHHSIPDQRYKDASYVRSTTQKSATKEKIIPVQTTRMKPIIFNPRPFGTQLIVRPENQQTNQVNNFDSQRIVEINFNKYREPDQHHVDLFMNTMMNKQNKRPVKDNSRFEVAPTVRKNSSQIVYPEIFVITSRPTSKIPPRPRPRPTPSSTTTTTTTRHINLFKNKNQRPKVTSLPIDVPTTTNKTTKPGPFVTSRTTTPKPKLFNTGEVLLKFRNISEEINDLEMMKPPPRMPAHIPKKPSLVELKRPVHKDEASTPGPFVAKGSDEVVGMSPPPAVFSTTTAATQRSRRPFTRTRRPGIRRTTTAAATSYKPLYRRTTTGAGRNRSTTGTRTEVTKISPTPTFKLTSPTLVTGDDALVSGDPKNDQESQESNHQIYVPPVRPSPTPPPPPPPPPEIISSRIEAPINTNTREVNANLSSSSSIKTGLRSSSIGSATFTIHHAGNKESKIDASMVSATPPLPTKYVTYTTTATLTITKTIVLTTSGGPPSTTTILITTTETSTIIDTITQTQTLIKPTSIIQTVTTTIQNSLYPSDIYRSSYPPPIHKEPIVIPTVTIEQAVHDEDVSSNSGSLEDFIITDTDPPFAHEPIDSGENESIFVVMTDKNKGSIVRVPPQATTTPANTTNSYETQDRDEVLTANEVNNILLGGIFINNPSFEIPNGDKCEPECQPTRNELCQKVNNIMKCVCRPGFARMFPDRPCIPTYTYNVRLVIGGYGHQQLNYHHSLKNPNSTEYRKLAQVTHEALDRMVMQSDLRDIYHGVHIQAFEPAGGENGTEIVSKFYLQLSAATPIPHLLTILLRYLHHHNNSLGGTPLRTSSDSAPYRPLNITDFDECAYPVMHDCSEHAQCFNLPGTYTCSCREGHEDVSGNAAYPGRVCSGERGCERCHWRGKCFGEGESERCQCERWYTGETCQVNLKVLLIALATLGAVLILLLFTCLVMTCMKRKPSKARKGPGIGFLPQRAAAGGKRGTLDRRAMIPDSSSEDSRSERDALPYVAKPAKKPLQKRPPKGALKKPIVPSAPARPPPPPSGTLQSMGEQKDRSLPVLIPRARFQRPPQPPQPPRPPQLPPNPLQHYTTFDAGQPSVPSVAATQESKLLSYLDAGPSNKATVPERPLHPHPHPPRKLSSTHSDSLITEDKRSGSRKTSGALVSAGFEVSATVGCHTYRTCGTEADRSENATLVPRMSVDMMSEGGGSQFNTFRKCAMEDEMEQIDEDWMDLEPRIITMSEVRSCDETTIPPPVRTMREGDYNTNNSSSQQQNDEANTMAERDLGSTFILPHTHLYKPDRGSDISGFESL